MNGIYTFRMDLQELGDILYEWKELLTANLTWPIPDWTFDLDLINTWSKAD